MPEIMLPNNLTAEQSLLSMLLFSPRQMPRIADTIAPEHFYRDAHATIYTAIQTLYTRGKSCNFVNVASELQHRGEWDRLKDEPVFGMVNNLATGASLEDHADEILANYEWRRLAQAGKEIFDSGMHKDADAMERAEQAVYAIAMGRKAQDASPLAQALDRYMDGLKARRQNVKDHVANGIPTGFLDLDRALGGLQPSDFYVLAARPSKGKTSLAMNIACNIVSHAKRAVFFSLEMSEGQLVQRLLSMETPTDQMLLRDGTIEDDDMKEVEKTAMRLRGLDLMIDDRARKLSTIRSIARSLHAHKPLQAVFVDYLQIMHPESERGKNVNRTEEIAKLTAGLKDLAKELNVPVVVLAQLNRETEKSSDKRPQMSNLKDGGSIEQDADCVMFIHCAEDQLELRNASLPYGLDIIIDKHRNGRIGEVRLTFRPRSTKFEDLMVTPPLEETEVPYYAQ